MLGPNPVEKILHVSGDWTLRILLLTLALPGLANWFSAPWLLRARRIAGLYVFFYAVLHLLIYAGLDRSLDWNEIAVDILKRPYITLGMTAFVALAPLAVTSTNQMIRRLGARWKSLHRISYWIAAIGIVHYAMSLKADYRTPLIYATILSALLVSRAWARRARDNAGKAVF